MTASRNVVAQAYLPTARLRLLDIHASEPIDMVLRDDNCCRLHYAVSPRLRGTELCFMQRWPAHRFERAGQTFLLPPAFDLRIRSEAAGPLQMVVCELASHAIENLLDDRFEWTDRRLELSADVADGAISRLVSAIGQELLEPRLAQGPMIEAMTLQVAIMLARRLASTDNSARAGGLATWQLRAIDEMLRDPEGTILLVDLANVCRVSVRQLSRGFQRSTGQAIGRHVVERRHEQALALLRQDLPTGTVASRLGFSSTSSFCAAFRRSMGCSPRQYRSRFR